MRMVRLDSLAPGDRFAWSTLEYDNGCWCYVTGLTIVRKDRTLTPWDMKPSNQASVFGLGDTVVFLAKDLTLVADEKGIGFKEIE